MLGLPDRNEAAPYYFTYIDRIQSGDVLQVLDSQLEETTALLRGIQQEQSLHSYAPGKWTVREVWNHVNDTERIFVCRALWFARGLPDPLPSFDQNVSAAGADANRTAWDSHVEEFRAIRQSTLAFFRNLPPTAWLRSGIASGNPFTVRALAYITAGHVAHHTAILRDRYL